MNIRNIMIAFAAMWTSLASCDGADKNEIEGKKLEKKIAKEPYVVVNNKHIKGDVSLLSAGKGSGVEEYIIDSEMIFTNCVFEGNVSGGKDLDNGNGNGSKVRFKRGVKFVNCIFAEKPEFVEATFDGRVILENCVFNKGVNFRGAVFGDGLVCNSTEFQNEVVFSNAIIKHVVSFVKTKFRYHVYFDDVRMESNVVMMADSEYGHYCSMSNMYVLGSLNLMNAKFAGRVECIGTYIIGDVRLAGSLFKDNVTFEGNKVTGEMLLSNALFEKELKSENNYFAIQPKAAVRESIIGPKNMINLNL